MKRLKNKKFIALSAVVLVAVVLVVPHIAHASSTVSSVLLSITSWLAQQIVYVVGQLLLIAIEILIRVASFNDFINANVVNIGWVVVRDIANMAIVIALLVIAFNTVLNKANYGYQQMLPKLIGAAILVNFSKTIAGLLIDVSQVVMMTFVHAFENIAAGNLTYGFGIHDLLSIRDVAKAGGASADINDWNVMGAMILAALMVVIALGVVISMAVMLLMRVVRIWILVIFSPIAYVAGLFGGEGKKYHDQWWGDFTKQLIFGPTLAFLFWLSMTVLSQITASNRIMNLSALSIESAYGTASTGGDYAYFASQVSSPQRVFDFMVTAALLSMCLIFASKAGVMGAEVAGNFMKKLKGSAKWIGKKGWNVARKHVGATGVAGFVLGGGPIGMAAAIAGRKILKGTIARREEQRIARGEAPTMIGSIMRDRVNKQRDDRAKAVRNVLKKVGVDRETFRYLSGIQQRDQQGNVVRGADGNPVILGGVNPYAGRFRGVKRFLNRIGEQNQRASEEERFREYLRRAIREEDRGREGGQQRNQGGQQP